MIHRELCNRLKLTIVTNEICTNQEKGTHKILWNFKIQTRHQNPSKIPNLVLINKKKRKIICYLVDFAVPADHRLEIKEIENKYVEFVQKGKWLLENVVVCNIIGEYCNFHKATTRTR